MTVRQAVRASVVALAATATLAAGQATAGAAQTLHKVKVQGSGILTVNLSPLQINSVSRVKGTLGKGWLISRSGDAVTTPEGSRSSGTSTFIADDGDMLLGTYTAVGPPPADGVHTAQFDVTFTGGTGRFRDATGMTRGTTTGRPFILPSPGSPFLLQVLETVSSGWIRY